MGRAGWADADTDPKLIRSYQHPVDGWYFLGDDIVAWLRDLAAAARAGDPISSTLHAPLIDLMAETAERWITDSERTPGSAAPEGAGNG